jgi:hypothetical protein
VRQLAARIEAIRWATAPTPAHAPGTEDADAVDAAGDVEDFEI